MVFLFRFVSGVGGRVRAFVVKHQQLGRMFLLALSLLTLFLSYSAFNLFLNARDFGFNRQFIDTTKTLTVQGFSIYGVQVGREVDTLERAKLDAGSVRARGGAGFVINSGSLSVGGGGGSERRGFRVIASAYVRRADAQSVVNGLATENIQANVVTISVPNIKVRQAELTHQTQLDIQPFKNILDLFKQIYNVLYTLSVGLDTSQILVADAQIQIAGLLNEANAALPKLEQTEISQILLQIISKHFNNVTTGLSALVNLHTSKTNFSANVKYTYLSSIWNLRELALVIG
ncbi:MAG: hypothetical protein FWB72_03155 [Firmicutes bacterium]|nr:hypothetical protein [Bacillota bacterium]